MSLMKDIRTFPVEKGSVAMWWFGQNGYIFKSPEGTLLSVDLYLTDSCNGLNPAFDLRRGRVQQERNPRRHNSTHHVQLCPGIGDAVCPVRRWHARGLGDQRLGHLYLECLVGRHVADIRRDLFRQRHRDADLRRSGEPRRRGSDGHHHRPMVGRQHPAGCHAGRHAAAGGLRVRRRSGLAVRPG